VPKTIRKLNYTKTVQFFASHRNNNSTLLTAVQCSKDQEYDSKDRKWIQWQYIWLKITKLLQ